MIKLLLIDGWQQPKLNRCCSTATCVSEARETMEMRYDAVEEDLMEPLVGASPVDLLPIKEGIFRVPENRTQKGEGT